ncbi:MAG: aldo/keto reductase [Verrucomicrobia bacterium]|nr:aldo/keto reductase [Verrucomicrobiota bacterium]
MQTRRLGNTDLEFTVIGLGTWAMGGGNWEYSWGPQNDQESIKAIHRALDLGINWIDTAPAYGLGHAEEIVGRALAGMRDRPFIATKCGLVWDDRGRISACLEKSSVSAEIDASLKRLGVDRIDLYQVHWPRDEVHLEEGWEAIAAAVKAGKIRHAGVSNFNVDQIRRLQPILPVASLQPPYSLLEREVESELLPFCAAEKIGVVVYSPMQKGLLTGRMTRERIAQFPPDDHRRRDPQFREPLLTANLQFAECLSAIAQQHGRNLAQLAVAWVLRRPEVTSAIVGIRRPSQLDEIVGAADWRLTEADLQAIDRCLQKREQTASSQQQ